MKHLAAYLLLTLGGNSEPSAEDVKEVLSSVGIDADEGRLAQLLSELHGRDINELIAEGSSKLATVVGSGSSGETRVETGPDTKSVEGGSDDDSRDDDDDDDEDGDFGLGLFG
ncbi:hypothetical protein BDW62DRAFT_143162 [Aspergillus aurantiobrunneus]